MVGGAQKVGLWERLRRVALTDVSVLIKGLDRDRLEEVERILVEADFGPVAFRIVEALEEQMRLGAIKSEQTARRWLESEIERYVHGVDAGPPLNLGDGAGPGVVLVLGVNGVGKTTVIARLAYRLLGEGKRVLLAAADTYRAGATEQIREWAGRLDVPCITGSPGGDPAAVAYDAVGAATARGVDVVLVDTAGRLHTHGDLMEQLKKIVRVVGRRREGAPHETLLVLDGTVGQNALRQGKAFAEAVTVTGLVITKMDGTAKGGAVLSVREELGVPVKFIGVGEGLADLEEFAPQRFIDRLLAG